MKQVAAGVSVSPVVSINTCTLDRKPTAAKYYVDDSEGILKLFKMLSKKPSTTLSGKKNVKEEEKYDSDLLSVGEIESPQLRTPNNPLRNASLFKQQKAVSPIHYIDDLASSSSSTSNNLESKLNNMETE